MLCCMRLTAVHHHPLGNIYYSYLTHLQKQTLVGIKSSLYILMGWWHRGKCQRIIKVIRICCVVNLRYSSTNKFNSTAMTQYQLSVNTTPKPHRHQAGSGQRSLVSGQPEKVCLSNILRSVYKVVFFSVS